MGRSGIGAKQQDQMWLSIGWLLLLLPVMISCSIPLCACSGRCSSSDRQALLDFRQSLENAGFLKSWDDNNGSWEGVVFRNGHVVEALNLSGKGLSGRLIPIWSMLRSVTLVDLSANNFSGEITPAECSSGASKLKILKLSRNSLGGSLQSVLFSGMIRLEVLDLSGNRLSGDIAGLDFSPLQVLKTLNISQNSFQGQLPAGIGNLSRLQVLDLRFNSFTGPVPPGFANLRNLTGLNLSNNALTGTLPGWLGNCTSLVQLELSNNNFTGGIPVELGRLPRLTTLGIGFNHLSDHLHFPPGLFQSLQSLYLPANAFKKNITNSIGNLVQLKKLVLTANQFSGPIPLELGRCTHIEELWLNSNSLSGSIPDTLFSKLSNLRYLALDDNNFEGPIPAGLSSCSMLQVLWLEKNKFSGGLPSSLGNLSRLLMMSVSDNQLVGSLPQTFAKLKNLIGLDVSDNRFNSASSLAGLDSLQFLFLSNNKFIGQVPNWIWSFRALRALDFSFNDLTGEIPSYFNALTALMQDEHRFNGSAPSAQVQTTQGQTYQGFALPTTIDLSHNQLTGSIPPQLGTLKNLQVLCLGYNNLTGTIPENLSTASSLMKLDLSFNQLIGQIPSGLSRLTFLESFDVSYNHLTGEIPNSPQFNTFTESWFYGNQLCGIPLNVSCQHQPSTSTGGEEAKNKMSSQAGRLLSSLLPFYVVICGAVGAFSCFVVYFFISRRISRISWSPSSPDRCYNDDFYETMAFSETLRCRVISPRQLASATNNYSEANIIGDGGFGIVYRAVLDTGEVVAVKKLSSGGIQGEKEFRAEVQILGRMKHAHLVPLLGYCLDRTDRVLIYKYLTNGSLDSWLHCREEQAGLDWSTRLKIARGAAQGISFLHHECFPPIIHRDIKASNILLDQDFSAHIADFGMARLVQAGESHVSTDVAGTVGYIPPEYNHKCRATTKGDVYGFGVVCLELLTAKRPTDSVFRKLGAGNLVNWVLNMKTREEMKLALDESMMMKLGHGSEEDILEMMRVGCLCCRSVPSMRPSMMQVVEMLVKIERRVLHQSALKVDNLE